MALIITTERADLATTFSIYVLQGRPVDASGLFCINNKLWQVNKQKIFIALRPGKTAEPLIKRWRADCAKDV